MQQTAYRHMMVKYKLLQEHDEGFREAIPELKRTIFKTESPFAKVITTIRNIKHFWTRMTIDGREHVR